MGQLVGLAQPPLRSQQQPVGDVVVQRAVHLTERHAALRAAAGLLGSRLGIELVVNLAEVLATQLGAALVRHRALELDELQHPAGHRLTPNSRPTAPVRPAWSRRLLLSPKSEEHTSAIQSLMRLSYAGFCMDKTTQ